MPPFTSCVPVFVSQEHLRKASQWHVMKKMWFQFVFGFRRWTPKSRWEGGWGLLCRPKGRCRPHSHRQGKISVLGSSPAASVRRIRWDATMTSMTQHMLNKHIYIYLPSTLHTAIEPSNAFEFSSTSLIIYSSTFLVVILRFQEIQTEGISCTMKFEYREIIDYKNIYSDKLFTIQNYFLLIKVCSLGFWVMTVCWN